MRKIDQFISELDRTVIDDLYRGVGSKPHEPMLMLRMGLYGNLLGQGSPAAWHTLTIDSKSMQWLIRGIRPSRSCCYNFRDRIGSALENLAAQVVNLCIDEGLVRPKAGVQDGSTFRAAGSRHRVANMKTLTQRQATLAQAIRQDQAGLPLEDAPKWMPTTPRGRRDLQQRYEKAAQILAQRQQENAAKRKDRRLAENKVQVCLSEPEAPLGRDKERVFCPLYTSQYLVEPSSLLILNYSVLAQSTDAGTLPVMADAAQQVLGYHLETIIADGAYASLIDLRACEERGIELIAGPEVPAKRRETKSDKQANNAQTKTPKKPPKLDKSEFTWQPEERTYRCPEGHLLTYCQKDRVPRRGGETLVELRFRCPPEHCLGCHRQANCVDNPAKGRVVKRLEGQELLDAHQEKMKTDRARELYKLRGQVVERSFADSKHHRKARRLHGRGLLRAKAEIGLLVLVQNLLTVFRLRRKRANPENQVA